MTARFANTKVESWSRLWRRLEEAGLPVDSQAAAAWDRANGNYQRARILLDTLNLLHDLPMSMGVIDTMADALVYAFKLGRESDGPPPSRMRDSALDVVRDLIERHDIKPTDL